MEVKQFLCDNFFSGRGSKYMLYGLPVNDDLHQSIGLHEKCKIREVTNFDAPLLARFTFPLFRDRLLVGSWKPKVVALGVWLESRPVGLVLFEITSGSVAALRSVWIEQDCRRRGVGLALLQKGTDALRSQGVRKLEAVHRSTLEESLPNWMRLSAWFHGTRWIRGRSRGWLQAVSFMWRFGL